ncbi:MAG: FAD-dependent oxidoreductase [Deltaproteobacteria bacterium]|nr:FAD-dependent oxidoreductase [Deltaproteobacteria bacterium]MBI3390200.1 FAD-dependent oxidoreductase [Deltaproteobacteria bacterium]
MIDFIDEPARRTPVLAETQVLVVGGGSAGAAAAIAAARTGADVMLVERSGSLGGLATSGLIILLLTLDDGDGHQVIGGLCQEVVDRLAARNAAFFPSRDTWGSSDESLVEQNRRWGLVWGAGPHRVRYSVAYDPEEFRFALNRLCEASKVRLLFHSWACEAIRDGERVRGVTFQSKSGRFAVLADVVIDTTGDGDIFASAGVPFELEKVLPWLWFRMGGVKNIDAAIADGGWFFKTIGVDQVLLPWGATDRVIRKIDATDPRDLTLAEIECRKKVMDAVDQLRRDVPEFKDAHLCDIATQLGITESRRMIGEYVLTREDMDKPLPEAIALTGHWTKYGALYWIPYRSLLAKEYTNLMAAGRCISVDHRTHHATKEIPSCMATGEAAGTAAALALSAGVPLKQLDVSTLQQRLRDQGAILERR